MVQILIAKPAITMAAATHCGLPMVVVRNAAVLQTIVLHTAHKHHAHETNCPAFIPLEMSALQDCWQDDPAKRTGFEQVVASLRTMLQRVMTEQQQSNSCTGEWRTHPILTMCAGAAV